MIDVKFMFKIDKEIFKMLGIMTIFSFGMSTIALVNSDMRVFLVMLLLPPTMFAVAYFGKYKPLFKEIIKDHELQQEYSFMYKRFTK